MKQPKIGKNRDVLVKLNLNFAQSGIQLKLISVQTTVPQFKH